MKWYEDCNVYWSLRVFFEVRIGCIVVFVERERGRGGSCGSVVLC